MSPVIAMDALDAIRALLQELQGEALVGAHGRAHRALLDAQEAIIELQVSP